MIVFQVSLNFDPVKEILKIILCQIYILMKKVIILRKIHVTMKSFAPPQKKTKHIRASAANLLHAVHTVLEQEISIGANVDIIKTKREKQIVFVVERRMQSLVLWLKSQRAREESLHPAFMSICPTISRTCQPYLPCR